MFEIFQYEFMQRAFIAGTIIGVLAPLLGVFIVARRASMLSDTLAHIALMGVGIGFFLEGKPLLTAILATTLVAILIDKLVQWGKIGAEAIQAVFLTGGLAIALLLVSLSNGAGNNFESFLFGSIVTVSMQDIYTLLALGTVILGTLYFYWWRFMSFSLNAEYAQASGIRINVMSSLLAMLTGVTVALSLRIIGGLLIGALMVIPVLTAMQFSKSFSGTSILAMLLGAFNTIIGLTLAYFFDLPSGATIALLSVALFLLSFILKQIRKY